ncbi:periodic tryptophan protein 2 [Trichuris trichiura]|uniref:Periodic tryptophan protein 2 n=1 Tax=Trichuris trichiura TaxID=36087 RepID=A0A077ZAB8_TRITR|nr:periodic tryptophan protein 2 [Trichuris trichiura]
MRLDFRFSNLVGTVYRGGNLLFASGGNCVLSPVGNKVTTYDLRNHRSETLPVETTGNVQVMALDPSETAILLIDEYGDAFYLNLLSRTVLHRYHFNKPVRCAKFSPDGQYFAVCRDTDVDLFRTPGLHTLSYRPFYTDRVFNVAHDVITCIDWSHDSKSFIVGSKDLQTRICRLGYPERIYGLSGHAYPIVLCGFLSPSYDVYTLDSNGVYVSWRSEEQTVAAPEEMLKEESQDDDSSVSSKSTKKNFPDRQKLRNLYKKISKHKVFDSGEEPGTYVTSAFFHAASKLLVTGHSNGCFVLHELPEFLLIHSLSISEFPINSVVVNSTGEWIALGSSRLGQLLVWEWQSETYVMKQQGHFHNMASVSYSPNGALIATGGYDGKVKVWNVDSGFCFVTFDEHKGDVTGVAWTQAGKSVLSSSLDGTVRAFDLKRYRNFRTFVAPEAVQFSCLSVDSNGEIVCAGGRDVFNVYIWSMCSGRLLDVLSGHEAPVCGLSFCGSETVLASCSWDKRVIVWNIFEGKGGRDALECGSEVLDVKFSPNGDLIACCCLNCQILFFDWRTGTQVLTIEGRLDLDTARGETEVTKETTSALTKSFSTICFSPDGEYILAAGRSPVICLYHVQQEMIVKKFRVTTNRSIDCVDDHVDKRKLSEFGNLALVDVMEDNEEVGTQISLPGFRAHDPGIRTYKPEINVSSVQFSPTGRAWAACSNEGVLIYSLDCRLTFDPYQLDIDVLPSRVHELLSQQDFSEALMMAVKLNQPSLMIECMEKTPALQIDCVCKALPEVYAEKVLSFIGEDPLASSVHLEFYLLWVRSICLHHGLNMKLRMGKVSPAITKVLQSLKLRQKALSRMQVHRYSLNAFRISLSFRCDSNKYTLSYLLNVPRRVEATNDVGSSEDAEIDNLMDTNGLSSVV